MTKPFKPMLAGTPSDLSKLQYPLLASPKLDGIRCVIRDGVALTRSLKRVPQPEIQEWVASWDHALDGLDGELIVGVHDDEVFRRTTSFVMKKKTVPCPEGWAFYVFDCVSDEGFEKRLRLASLVAQIEQECSQKVHMVQHVAIENHIELLAYETDCLAAGFEGVMVRSPDGAYKCGRSTEKEGGLLKIKQFLDDEAEIIGFEERQHNTNEATTNELGATERSTHKAGLVGTGDLGAFRVVRPDGVEFSIGSGFSSDERIYLWANRHRLIGRLVKYQYFAQGIKDKPRFPTYKGLRSRLDL